MQMEGLTRIYRCRYFRGSSLHFFYRLITGYLTGAKNALCGFLLHIVGRILFLLFEPRLFSPCYYLKLKQKYRCRRNISSLYPATTRTAFYPSDLRALWTLWLTADFQCPEFHCVFFVQRAGEYFYSNVCLESYFFLLMREIEDCLLGVNPLLIVKQSTFLLYRFT